MTKIAIDCMGGDHGLSVTIPAALRFLQTHSDVFLYLVGPADQIEQALLRLNPPRERLEIQHAEDVVLMTDSLEVALRQKKNSSMRVAAELVQQKKADACISAGNTGAWMAIARYVLKTMEGVDRPAIATFIPSQKKPVTMLDLGANVDCSAQHLLQFAIMGVAFCQAVEQHERPSVGLLNVGEELIKGNEVVKETAEFLRLSPLNFYGNVEGDDIYKGTVDVVVCDGFVGNIVLKSSEGLAKMFANYLTKAFHKNILTKLVGLCVLPVLRGLRSQLDHRRYNGAALLGLRGVVFKSHGSADAFAFECALERARLAVNSQLLNKISTSMQTIQSQLAQSADQSVNGQKES